ncbi:hypothetical protein GALMADRAFT_240456 [Galerina marginata CBS 339.88]|uniref:OPA3-domain-containing protein n=1 Tax=Galerina marginata (strain CBS 339.88) TaxID=685588 RepID=A0A067TI71_GALM3|nr:hypothetical protein GALMADRAFT_240456 [Galerina marginata CBS 339.88]
MASAKIATLLIRTLAKPISNQIKEQVRQHERFRGLCVNLAQFMYRTEVKMRTNILGEPARHIRPLSEAKAIDNGANALAEGFLFSVAAALIIAETWRSSRNASKRRDNVDDQLDDLGSRLTELTSKVDNLVQKWEDEKDMERLRYNEMAKIIERVVDINLQAGLAELKTPLQLPRIKLTPPLGESSEGAITPTGPLSVSSSVTWPSSSSSDIGSSSDTAAQDGPSVLHTAPSSSPQVSARESSDS